MNSVLNTAKLVIAAVISIYLARYLGLKYEMTAGIIALLSVQTTRRESVRIAMRRWLGGGIALSIGMMILSRVGTNLMAFALYLGLFITIVYKLNIVESMVPATVLVTHFFTAAESVTIGLFINEILLLCIGTGVALIVNLYMPDTTKQMLAQKYKVEEDMRGIIISFSKKLQDNHYVIEEDENLELLYKQLLYVRDQAYKNSENQFLHQQTIHYQYLDMRLAQYQVLVNLSKLLNQIYDISDYSSKMVNFTRNLADSIEGRVEVEILEIELKKLFKVFSVSKLPVSRVEFEQRAILYQVLNSFEVFLQIKKEFKYALSKEQLKTYKSYYRVSMENK